MKDLRNLTRILISLAASAGLTACDPGSDGQTPDGGAPPPDAPCTTWYPDDDNDGYGDSQSLGEVNCEQFAGTVDNKLDCDDSNRFRRPDHPEVCDDLDNDCNGVPETACVGQCDPLLLSDGTIYLICSEETSFAAASDVCINQGMTLVHINSLAEENLLRQQAPVSKVWIGAADTSAAGPDVWRWIDDGENFWNGGAVPGGQGVPGVYSGWAAGFPEVGDTVDCAWLETALGGWRDVPCASPVAYEFICERTPDPS